MLELESDRERELAAFGMLELESDRDGVPEILGRLELESVSESLGIPVVESERADAGFNDVWELPGTALMDDVDL